MPTLPPPACSSFEREADALISRQRTRGAQTIVRAAVRRGGGCCWSGPRSRTVDEVTRGDARVIPSRQLQVVQSLDGGVVSEILVREGQVVEAGQLLLRIDETRAGAGVRESAAQGFALRARAGAAARAGRGLAFVAPEGRDADEERIVAGRAAPVRVARQRTGHACWRSTASSSRSASRS